MTTPPEWRSGMPITEGALLPEDPAQPPIPLKHTAINAAVIGPIVDVSVIQQFHNTHTAPIDAIYAFPLPEDAAITELTLRLGERVINGLVREREQARADYNEASATGQGAALLEQQRSNLFTIAVANIQPDETVAVTLRFQDRVPYDDGAFSLTFPTVVLPRYVPAEQSGTQRTQAGLNPLNPPLLPPDTRAGHTLSVTVGLDVGTLAQISSPSHEVDIQTTRGQATVTLRQADAVPNKDFVLRYRVAGVQFNATTWTYRAEHQPGTVLLMLTPKAELHPEDVLPREVLFVVDRSGSMMGDSIVQARNALRACLRSLNPEDTFNIFPFDDKVEQLAPAALSFTQANVDRADAYIAGIEARGGTEILGALRQAMQQAADSARVRLVVFLTDGAVGNEDSVLRELQQSLGAARVFAFGIGSAVNRFLLDKLAEVGRGSVEYLLPGEAIEDAVQRFQNRAAFPVLVDVALDWGNANVVDALPTPLPDLYASQPLSVVARYHSTGTGTITLSGRTPRGRYQQTLDVEWPSATPDRSEHWTALQRVWARARIDALMTRERNAPQEKSSARDEIIGLALAQRLVTPYTSLVAIEERRADHTGRTKAETVIVPIHLPAGTRREAFEPSGSAAGGAVMFRAMAMPAPFAPPPLPAPASAPQMRVGGGGLLKRLGSWADGGASAQAAKPGTGTLSSPPAAPMSQDWARGIAADAAHADTRTSAERYDAALRFLGRTQNVNGSWGDSTVATALALLAFVRGGHTDRAGSYRPQLTRAVRWLVEQAKQAQVVPVVGWAFAELAQSTGNDAHAQAGVAALAHPLLNDDLDRACLARAQGNEPALPPIVNTAPTDERGALALALRTTTAGGAAEVASLCNAHQEHGGSTDGAVVPPKHSAAQPNATLFAVTAAGALAWAADKG